jgi:hypothetical protein
MMPHRRFNLISEVSMPFFACQKDDSRRSTHYIRNAIQPKGCAMWITRSEAVEMYARFCLARYGELAPARVSAKAKYLAENGDAEGERIWNEVGGVIQRKLEAASGTSPQFAVH